MAGSEDDTRGTDPAPAPAPGPTHAPSHVVCLGASAGGLEALAAFFDRMPARSGAAFVVVQHLAPDHKSLMAELLARHTEMPVLVADEGTRVQPDTVYLIPPRKNLAIVGGHLRLTEKPHGAPLNLPIDLFLRSLAEDQAERSVAIILSGTGSDGMRGLQAVKAAGGLVIVQDAASAKFDGMPRSALSTGLADYVLPPEEIGAQLVQSITQTAGPATAAPPLWATDQESLAALLSTIRRQTGIDFSQYKPGTVLRRIERRMHVQRITTLADYAALVRQSPREVTTLCKEFLIGVTKFFRDPEIFESLEKTVIPALLAETSPHEPLRVWVPGCATGEEAYTLAILFHEAIEAARRPADVKIFATDIDREALDQAALGSYPDSIVADIAPERLQRFFIGNGETFQVTRPLRQSVVFAPHNVAADPPFARLDLISCRNLLIYLEPALQRRVLATFHFALRPGRYLLLGPSESIGDLGTYFRPVDARSKIFQRTAEVALPLLEALPSESLTAPLARLGRFEALGRTSEADVALDRAVRDLVERHAPPAVLLNERLELVHTFGDLHWLLRIPRGEASLNMFTMLPRRVGSVLNLCAQKALRDDVPVRHAGVAYELGEHRGELDLLVRPVQDRRLQSKYLLVEFVRHGHELAPQGADATGGAQQAEERRWAELHTELQHAKDSLQATIEELETSNEELQATNEELLSSNEELQSTNEELQSVNEELLTVNAEYQSKIHELSQLTHDIDNLLRSTSVATLFLDENLTIRRFTPDVSAVISLIPRDLGRPIEHFAINLAGVDFFAELRRVVATRKGSEHEVIGPDGRVFLMRALPYVVDGTATGSVVVTFVEVTRIKDTERRLQWILDSLPEHIAVLDPRGAIVLVNAAWRRFAEENGGAVSGPGSVGVGVNYLEICERARGDGAEAARTVARGLRDVLSGHLSNFRYEYPCDSPGVPRWFVMHAAPLAGPAGGAVVSHIDMTRTRQERVP